MNQKTFVIIYGKGGHQEEMNRLLSYEIFKQTDDIQLISFSDSHNLVNKCVSHYYQFPEFRDKYSNLRTLVKMPWTLIKLTLVSIWVLYKYDLRGCVTTGPGLAIVPIFIFNLFRVKTVVFESWAKFYKPTFTAKILYHFSGLFIIQHKSMYKVFPNAKYWGRL